MKRMLKIYYSISEQSVVDATYSVYAIEDVTYCCNQIKKELDRFELDEACLDADEPALFLYDKDQKPILIACCPRCGGKVVLKPSRLGEKE